MWTQSCWCNQRAGLNWTVLLKSAKFKSTSSSKAHIRERDRSNEPELRSAMKNLCAKWSSGFTFLPFHEKKKKHCLQLAAPVIIRYYVKMYPKLNDDWQAKKMTNREFLTECNTTMGSIALLLLLSPLLCENMPLNILPHTQPWKSKAIEEMTFFPKFHLRHTDEMILQINIIIAHDIKTDRRGDRERERERQSILVVVKSKLIILLHMHSREPDELTSSIQMRHTPPEVRTVSCNNEWPFYLQNKSSVRFPTPQHIAYKIYLHITTFVKEYYNVSVRLLFAPRLEFFLFFM